MERDKFAKKIGIIGVGHMGKSLLQGLIQSGLPKDTFYLSDASKENKKVTSSAEWIILSVKPLQVKEVLEEIKDTIENKILISVAAGVSVSSLERMSSKKQKIVRIMPNLPVANNQGVIGLFANSAVTKKEKEEIKNLVSRLGSIIEVTNEEQLAIFTLIPGCGPGLVAYLMNVFSSSARALGLSEEDSEQVVLQTFKGTIDYLEKSGTSPKALQNAVATKGGVTEAVIQTIDENKLPKVFHKSIEKGKAKIDDLQKRIDLDNN